MRNYQTPGHPTYLSGLSNLIKFYPKLSVSKAKSILRSVKSYGLHADYKKPAVYNPIYVYGRRKLLQIDLADVSSLEDDNRGVKYLLTAIDTFSRKAWVVPLKSKSGREVSQAFLKVLTEMKELPERLLSDKGTEFTNAQFKKILSDRGIKSLHLYSDQKAAHVERFNRTLKRLMYMHMTHRGNSRYIDKLPEILSSYNNRVHSSINMAPNLADLSKNRSRVLSKLMATYGKLVTGRVGKRLKRQKDNAWKVGDRVRIYKSRGKFARGFERTFTREIFIIRRVSKNKPVVMYHLEDLNGEPIEGGFYENEIRRVDDM